MTSQLFHMSIDDLKMHGSDQIKSAAAILLISQLIGGAISCNELQSSGRYFQEVYTPVFNSYKQYIDRYCLLVSQVSTNPVR